MQYRTAMAYPKAMTALMRVPQIMERGITVFAFLTSSDMWITTSTPAMTRLLDPIGLEHT